MTRKFCLPFFFAIACSMANASAQTSPSILVKQLDDKGAKATISSMSESQWDNVLNHIDSGNAAWVALVPKLAEGTDGGHSEDLGIGLAFALPKNPKAVLSVIDRANGPVLGVSRVCSVPFIEDTVPDIPAYVRQAKAALGKVHDASLQDVKKSCLAELSKP